MRRTGLDDKIGVVDYCKGKGMLERETKVFEGRS